MTDKELYRCIKNGESGLMDQLVLRYYDDVYRFCRYKTGEDILAYDLTQDTFLKFIQGFDRYIEQGKLKAYLMRLAVNVTNDYYRNYYRKQGSDTESNEEIEAVMDITGSIATADAVQRAVARLPDIQKDVIILRFYHDMKVGEIAKILNINLATAKSRLKQGRDKLVEYLSEEGLP